MKRKNKVLIIIPAYNEEENIIKTCNNIFEYNKKNKSNYDIVVINDGSKDRTEDLLNENNINHIKLIQNLGIGGAVQTGYKYARDYDYDIAIQFDGDGQHDVNYIKNIIDPIINGEANLVIGSRFKEKNASNFQSSKARRLGIGMISWTIKFKTGQKIYDTTSGFRACDRKVIAFFASDYPTEYPEPISTVESITNKFKVVEVPVNMHERQGGKSSITSWKNAYYMFNVIISILLVEKKVK